MISFGTGTGDLLTRLAKCGAILADARSHQGTTETLLTSQATGLIGNLDADPDIAAIVGGSYLGVLSSLGGAAGPLVQQVATAAVNRAVYRDNPRVNQTLTNPATLASLQEIIRQMRQQGVSFRFQAVTAALTDFVGVGDAVVNCSVIRPFDGLTLENSFGETLNAVCTNDSYTGGATAGSEAVRFTGAGEQSDVFAPDWPRGSGSETSFSCIDGSQDNTAGNLLTNSGFDTWTDSVPDNWELVVGTAGTNISEDTGVTLGSGSSLKITGDAGGTLTQIRQITNDSDGTAGALDPLSQYSLCVWVMRDGTPSSVGTLELALCDENGVVLKDAADTECKTLVDLTALPTLYVPRKACFRTPLVVPDALYLRVRLTVALDDGRSVYLDRMGLGAMSQQYSSGPFVAAHSGGTPLAINDLAQVAINNPRGAGGTINTWITVWQRLLFSEIMGNELLFPSSPSPSVSDSILS